MSTFDLDDLDFEDTELFVDENLLCEVCELHEATHFMTSGCYCEVCYDLLEDELEQMEPLGRFEKFKHVKKIDDTGSSKKKKTPRRNNKYDDYTFDLG